MDESRQTPDESGQTPDESGRAAGPGQTPDESGRAAGPGQTLDGPATERSDGPGDAGAVRVTDAPGPAGREPDADTRFDALGPTGGVLVIGYGNALRSDDGVGVHAAGLLARDARLARVDVRAAVQLAPELALDMSRVSLVVLVDATVDAAPGQVLVRQLADDEASTPATSGPGATSHHVGAEELVTLARVLYGAAPEVVIVSVGVATMEAGETLSVEVAAALPGVADAVAGLVAGATGRTR